MYTFQDFYKNYVRFSFADHPFSKHPQHVFVICKYKDQWLLTRHKSRGLEFPGGKVEAGETAEQGAIREVNEETGALIQQIEYVGQYHVKGQKEDLIKNVYYAEIERMMNKDHYYETFGPVLMKKLPENIQKDERYSFMMKDDVLVHSLNYIYEQKAHLDSLPIKTF